MTFYFTKEHEWVRIEGDTATVGISEHAQHALGDVVYVDLPPIGKQVTQGHEAATVESVKAASEVYAPVSGEVVEVNATLPDTPGLVNSDPLGTGWFLKLKVKDAGEIAKLMNEVDYKAYLATLA